MPRPYNKKVVAVVSDLFFAAKINEAAKRAGVTVEYVVDHEKVLERADSQPGVIIFDLNLESADPLGLIGKLKENPHWKTISLIAFVPHVQGELRQEAQKRGCDLVLPRSSFSMNLTQILKRHAGAV